MSTLTDKWTYARSSYSIRVIPSLGRRPHNYSGVYFIYDGHLSVKIGMSKNPRAALYAHQTSNASDLRLLHVIPQEDLRIRTRTERELHALFADLWIRGEWFRYESELMLYLNGIRKECIDCKEDR